MSRTIDRNTIDMFPPASDWLCPTQPPDIPSGSVVAIDTEDRDDGLAQGRGPGWALGKGFLCGVSAAWGDESIYLPVRHPDTQNLPVEVVMRWLVDLEQRCTLVFQNAPFDLGWLGLRPTKRIYDTHAAAVLLDENELRYDLNALAARYGAPPKDESLLREAAAVFRVDAKAELWKLPARYVGGYAEGDAISTLHIHNRQMGMIAHQQLEQAYELECRLIPHIRDMRARGMRIDVKRAAQLSEKYKALAVETHGQIKRFCAADHRGDVTSKHVNSPQWLAEQFDHLGIAYPRTGAGNASFEKEFLERHPHEFPQLITMARRFEMAATKFLDNYLISYAHKGRIFAEINQLRDGDEDGKTKGTRSYRFSYSNPPLQQVFRPDPDRADPTHKDFRAGFVDIGTEIRSCFPAEQGEVFGAPDYSQQEYRWIVQKAYELRLPGAEEAVRRYQTDDSTDFHNYVRDVTGLVRKRAKDCNFAKAFGAGVPKFALMTGMKLEEAKSVMEQYDEKLPFVKMLAERCEGVAHRRGFVRLLDNYRCRFDKWEVGYLRQWERELGEQNKMPMTMCSIEEAKRRIDDPEHPWHRKQLKRALAHKACNRVIQGSAAVQTKKALLAQADAGMLPLLQMHDELGHSVPNERYARDIVTIMRDVVIRDVPFKVDAEFGATWGTCKKSYAEAIST